MIIPIGHEQNSVRRLPWVTFGVMILCGLAFVLSRELGGSYSRDMETVDKVFPAIEYYFEHPYLELDPRLDDVAFEGAGAETRDALTEMYRSEFPIPDDPATIREEQDELDRLTEAALGGFSAHPYFRFGLIPDRMNPLTMITHMFLHGGVLHLIGNLLILYLAGPFIEDVWGRPLFAAFYVASGIAAALFHVIFNVGSGVPMIGASGAIAGVMGAFLVRYWNTKIRFFYVFGLFFRGTFDAAAWIMLPLWFGEQLFMGTLTSGAGSGVAYWAHVGGFLAGVGGALFIKHRGIEERLASSIESKIVTRVIDAPEVERALEASAAGNVDQAWSVLAEQTRLCPESDEIALALWGVAVEQGRAAEAAGPFARVIRDELRRGEHELALTHWTELIQRVPGAPVDPDTAIRLAQLLRHEQRDVEAFAALRLAMLAGGTGMPPALALRIARLAGNADPALARAAARLALTHQDIDPAERSQAERWLSA